MTLSNKDALDLHNYFAVVGQQQRSIQGPILDKMWASRPWSSEQDAIAFYKREGWDPPVNPWVKSKSKPELTAKPTSSGKEEEPSYEMDTEYIELMGRVSRRLSMISVRHRAALALFYGDEGAVCAERMRKYGRIVSLFGMTKTGREIAKREKKAAGALKVTRAQLIQNAVGAAELAESPSASVAEAHAQAFDLRMKAERAYSEAGDRVMAERAAKKPRRHLGLVG